MNWHRLIGPGILLCLLVAGYALGLHHYLTLEAIAENREKLASFTAEHLWTALAVYMCLYALAVAVSFPGASVLTIVAGLLFGWAIGGTAAILSATLGAVIVFQITKSSFGDVFTRRAGPFLKRINAGFQEDAFSYLLFLRLVPAFPFWLVNIAPALANIKLRTFAITTLIGIIPGTFAFAFVGAGLDSVIAANSLAHAQCVAEKGALGCPFALTIGSLITPQLLAAFAALGVVSLVPVVLKKWKSRHVL
jgi:uncharacterized membrane protein YdjX (TVP38/TMEM64 family)